MDAGTVFSGSLTYFGLGDLIQLIGSNGSSGILQISSSYAPQKGKIFFSNGNPIDAECGPKTGLDAIYTLFGWTQGQFEFLLKSISQPVVIQESRMQIILNALKMFDDGEIESVGPITIEKRVGESPVPEMPLPLIRGPMVDYLYVLDEEQFEPGTEIVSEGKHGNWLWVVLDGIVQIVRKTPEGAVKIVRVGQGTFVGSIASFLPGDYMRSATAIAESKVLLGVLDSHRLLTEFNGLSREFKRIVLSLDNRLKQVTDHVVDYFCRQDPLVGLGQAVPYMKAKENEKKVCLITQGSAHVVRNTPAGEVLLASLFPGDFIGRLSFIDMDHEFFSASIYCSENLLVENLNPETLVLEYAGLSPTFKNFFRTIASCVSATSMMACEFKKIHATHQSRHHRVS